MEYIDCPLRVVNGQAHRMLENLTVYFDVLPVEGLHIPQGSEGRDCPTPRNAPTLGEQWIQGHSSFQAHLLRIVPLPINGILTLDQNQKPKRLMILGFGKYYF
jgi:hypothetical protein